MATDTRRGWIPVPRRRRPEPLSEPKFDACRDPEWIGGVDRVDPVTPLPLTHGRTVRLFGGFMDRPIVWLMLVAAFESGRHVGMHAQESPFPMDVDYRLEPIEGRRTRASIWIRRQGRGMYSAMPGELLGVMIRRSVQGDLKRLKRIGESPGG